MIWFKLEVFEFFEQPCVIFEAVEWPRHLTLDSLIQFFLLEGVLDALLLNQPLANLQVALAFVEVSHFARVVLLLAHFDQAELLALHLQGGLLLDQLAIHCFSLACRLCYLLVVKLEQLAWI